MMRREDLTMKGIPSIPRESWRGGREAIPAGMPCGGRGGYNRGEGCRTAEEDGRSMVQEKHVRKVQFGRARG